MKSAACCVAAAILVLVAAGPFARQRPRQSLSWPLAGESIVLPSAMAERASADDSPAAAFPSARAPSAETTLRTRDGYAIRVFLSASYKPDRATEQAYVNLLGSLLHGPELGELGGLYIDTPGEVAGVCGAGAIACYSLSRQAIVVPGRPPFPGAPVAYVIAHEYGHHIAQHRRNPLGSAELLGPAHWSQYEHVCRGLTRGVLKPGVESLPGYFEDPGEAWAEAYAQYSFPHAEPWRFDKRLAPNFRGSSAAIRADVLRPWGGASRGLTIRGTLRAGRPPLRAAPLPVGLDGTIHVHVRAPAGLVYRLTMYVGRRRVFSRTARGSRPFAPRLCVGGQALRVVVAQHSGTGRVEVRVRAPAAR